MMILALAALACGAIAGIFLATQHFRRKRMPVWGALLHGLGGAIGFTLVLLIVVREPNFRPIRESLYLLIATVAFGVVNLLFHIRKVRHRTSLIALHALCAVSGVGLLIRAIVVHVPEAESAPPMPPAEAPRTIEPAVASALPAVPSRPAPDAGPSTEVAKAPGDNSPAKLASDWFVVDESARRALDRPIYFESRSAAVSADSLSVLAEIGKALKEHPEIALLEVQGHADERGDDAQNVSLTQARAHSVVNALVGSGIARQRLHAAGYGARCPESAECRGDSPSPSCHTSEQWQRDRRVAFVVLRVGDAAFRGEVACPAGAALIPPATRRFHDADAK